MVGIPVMVDTFRNVRMIERLGVGIGLKKELLGDAELLYTTLKRVVDDERYAILEVELD